MGSSFDSERRFLGACVYYDQFAEGWRELAGVLVDSEMNRR